MIPYIKDRVCLNVLGGSLENALDIITAAQGHVLVGVLSSNYPDVSSAVKDMQRYHEALEGRLSVGLGGGNPMQWKAVCDIAREVKTSHYNQIFSAVGYNRACVNQEAAHINALVSPSGTPGLVKISTGPLSRKAEPALIPIETAILMIREMGGNAVKFFPMHGLSCTQELIKVAKACARWDMVLEPTGGIDLDNYEDILTLLLESGVPHVIPHVYSSIIDKDTKQTDPEKVRILYEITKDVLQRF